MMKNNLSDMQNSEEVIDLAFDLCNKNYSNDEIREILMANDDVKKCIAIMNIQDIQTQEFANLLIFHLTNHGGTVREAVAIKLEILFENASNVKFFQTDEIVNKICDAIIDINPNISRMILNFINKIDNKKLIMQSINDKIQCCLDNILSSDTLQNHQINKYYFKIYWLLEALFILENISIQGFLLLLKTIATLPEYTVREKVAKLAKKYKVNDLKSFLINDDNYYVRKIFE